MFLNPIGLLSGDAARAALADGIAVPLSNTGLAFTLVEEIDGRRGAAVRRTAAPGLATAECAPFADARAPFAGIPLDRPRVMGIVNVTPDSFSDGGDYAEPTNAAARAIALAEEGADIVDIGGESTRPGAAAISVAEEIDRVMPVIEAAAGAGLVVSVDTRNAETMRVAAAGGARIVNDVTALSHDPAALDVVASSSLSVVLMHMKGTPATMQAAPRYKLASSDVRTWLGDRADVCVAAGIPRERIAVDPGIGFGKTDMHNMEILDRAAIFHGIGCAVAIGVSRKSFIGRIAGVLMPGDRQPGTVAATLIALSRGVQIHRVHDVAAARQALDIWDALPRGA